MTPWTRCLSVSSFLLQVRKSTGDGAGATEFYKKLTKPKDDWVSKLRPLVLGKSQGVLFSPSLQFLTAAYDRAADESANTFPRPLAAKKLPRKVFVQPNTRVHPQSGEVELVEYPTTVEGVIQSFVERAL
jgi:dipeptidyl-peptidase-3